jgi:hypothetical protein
MRNYSTTTLLVVDMAAGYLFFGNSMTWSSTIAITIWVLLMLRFDLAKSDCDGFVLGVRLNFLVSGGPKPARRRRLRTLYGVALR